MHTIVTLTAVVLAVVAKPADNIQPYKGCEFDVKDDLGQPQPVYIYNDALLMPTGNTGKIRVNAGEQILIGCPSSTILHPNMDAHIQRESANVTCVSGKTVSGSWLKRNGEFGGLTCAAEVTHIAQDTNEKCFSNHAFIRVGFIVDEDFYTWYWSCFDRTDLKVLFVRHYYNAVHAVQQTKKIKSPRWQADNFFPKDINIDKLYNQDQQREQICTIVGKKVCDRYVTKDQYLTRGHLTAKSDYPFATAQRATFSFINAAPQWYKFNSGNWETLEVNLRARIVEKNYKTIIYTGTFDVMKLRDDKNTLQEIFLHKTRKVPVPLYFYKVAYDINLQLGTAFIGVNYPKYTDTKDFHSLEFCPNKCQDKSFSWLRWEPPTTTKPHNRGHVFCCTIEDFSKVIPHLPKLNVKGLLT